MAKSYWLNIPVSDMQKAIDFYTELGFRGSRQFSGNGDIYDIRVGGMPIMLVSHQRFEQFAMHGVSDTKAGSEVLISFDVASRAEVDIVARKVKEAGGEVFSAPAEIQGWMYGCAFTDLDGHRWNALYMDMEKMKG